MIKKPVSTSTQTEIFEDKKISILKNTEENDFIARLIKLFVQIELTITYIQ